MNRAVLLAVIFGACASAFGTNSLLNGDFESQPNFGGGFANDAGFSAFTGSQIPGWTIESGHALTVHNTVMYPYISGNYSVNLDGEGFNGVNADFYQDFASTPGGFYDVAYDYKNWNSTTTTFSVSVTDTVTNNVLFNQVSAYSPVLVNQTGSFVGTGNALRLRIAEVSTGFNDNAFILDNVSVTLTPEPALAMAGLASLAVIRRQRR